MLARSRFWAVWALLVVSLLISAAVPARVLADSLRVAIGEDLESTDPQRIRGAASRFFQVNVFESLYRREADGQLAPALATRSRMSPDGRRVEFTLRRGVRLHDGGPFTARDVKFSLDRARDPSIGAPGAAALRNIVAVEVLGPYRVVFTLGKPDAAFLSTLEYRLSIVPEQYIRRVGDDEFARRPVGTGPFRFISRSVNEEVRLERFDSYWGSKPSFRTLVFRIVPEPASREALLERGDVDIAADLPFEDVDAIRKNPALKVMTLRTNERTFIKINTLHPHSPLDDTRVRQALNYAIDKRAIIDGLLNGFAVETASGVTQGIAGYDPSVKPYPYDPAKAKTLLAQAGFAAGFDGGELLFPGTDRVPKLKDVMEAVAAFWSDVGVTVRLHAVEYSAWLAAVSRHRAYGFAWMVRHETTWDPEERLLAHDRCGGFYSLFCANPEMDRMIDGTAVLLDPRARQAYFRRFFRLFHDDPPEVFLYETVQVYGLRRAVQWHPGDGNVFLDLSSARIGK